MGTDDKTKLMILEAMEASNAKQESRMTWKFGGTASVLLLLLGFLLNNSYQVSKDVSAVATQVKNNTEQIDANSDDIIAQRHMLDRFFSEVDDTQVVEVLPDTLNKKIN